MIGQQFWQSESPLQSPETHHFSAQDALQWSTFSSHWYMPRQVIFRAVLRTVSVSTYTTSSTSRFDGLRKPYYCTIRSRFSGTCQENSSINSSPLSVRLSSCQRRVKSESSATWVVIFMPGDSLPVASVARTRPDHPSGVSASSAGLHVPRQRHYSSDC